MGIRLGPFFENQNSELLINRLDSMVDGDRLKYTVEGGAYIREHFWGTHPDLLKWLNILQMMKSGS